MRTIYLDHAATTPAYPEVVAAMLPYFSELSANPASAHGPGRAAREAVEAARASVARLVHARPEELVFTSGGTEGNNTALLGVVQVLRGTGHHVVTSTVEHKSVLAATQVLETRGMKVTRVPVGKDGCVNPDDVSRALTPATVLVSIMHANNEVGTLQPIREISALARRKSVLMHTDAVQTAGHVPVDVDALQVDLLTLSAHKLGGPKGAGALFVRRGTRLAPLLLGGDQEAGRRASTHNVPGIVGLGKAAELCAERMEAEGKRLQRLQELLIRGVAARVRGTHLHGHPTQRLPGNVNVGFEDAAGEILLQHLDNLGIACATGSACDASHTGPSHVLRALGVPDHEGTLRFSLGHTTTEEDVNRLLEVLPGVVKKVRALTEMLD